MNVKYCGPAFDYSGYGEANRHDIAALLSAGVDTTVELTRHCLEISEFGKLGQTIQSVVNKGINYDIKILHVTPNIYNRFIEPGKYHVGRVIWETTKLPPDFVRGIEMVDEIWTASEFTAKAIRNSGIKKPIYVIPEAIDPEIPSVGEYAASNKKDFVFYSIFEWTERKNPKALLQAFWQEFQGAKNVSLVLKTYVDNFTPEKKKELKNEIRRFKNKLKLSEYPPVYIVDVLMTRNQIYRFHNTYDCFVSTHRGEGWGIPQMEAMAVGKPVISTACGGIHEYLTHEKEAYLIPYKLIPLKENSRNQQWYLEDQEWADVDVKRLRKAMRFVYENPEKAARVGEAGKQAVMSQFATNVVGEKMLSRLEQIVIKK